MKSAARVFIILGMIIRAIVIFPIILGLFALKTLKDSKSQDDLIIWGIVSIFFVSFIGGIIMILYACTGNINKANTQISKEDATLKLNELKDLYDKGIINKKTYNKKKKQYIEVL